MSTLESNITAIQDRIHRACARVGRSPNAVTLVAATKTQSIAALKALYDFGLRDFGENRVQELIKKRDQLPQDICWHMIGHLQSNKIRAIIPFIESIDSIDSIETANEVSKRAAAVEREIDILIEVNISGENSKEGVMGSDVEPLVVAASKLEHVRLRGLMGMASFEADPERVRPQFLKLKQLQLKMQERHPELKHFTELSMGMSNDFEIAIECGATMVRIGSALFGERIY